MSMAPPIDVFVCGPLLYGDNLAHLRLRAGMVIWEPFENETPPAPEPIREVYHIPTCGGLTLLVTDEGLYLSPGTLEPDLPPSAIKAVQP